MNYGQQKNKDGWNKLKYYKKNLVVEKRELVEKEKNQKNVIVKNK